MAQEVTGYTTSKTFQIGTSTKFLIAYVYTDESKFTIKELEGFDVKIEMMGDEEGDKYVDAIVAANTWAQAQLNPAP